MLFAHTGEVHESNTLQIILCDSNFAPYELKPQHALPRKALICICFLYPLSSLTLLFFPAFLSIYKTHSNGGH